MAIEERFLNDWSGPPANSRRHWIRTTGSTPGGSSTNSRQYGTGSTQYNYNGDTQCNGDNSWARSDHWASSVA